MNSIELKHFWRMYGSLVLLLVMLIGVVFMKFEIQYGGLIIGASDVLMLTVPCGISIVNSNKILWYIRQCFFLLFGILLIIENLNSL
jgi:hypothetical protein